MTTTRQHIEDLDVEKWATLTRRAAADSLAAAERLGLQPRAETVALAALSDGELAGHRQQNGPPVPRRSLAMQLVDADHRRSVAEEQARVAQQGRLDAEAAAALARAEAEESARVATAAAERVRALEAESARKDAERSAERAAEQKALEAAQAEIERIRAQAAADVTAAQQKAEAADARAVERGTERTADRAAGEQTTQHLRAEIERIRAEAAADVAAAEEKAKAAEARAEERSAERATERAAGEEAVMRVHRELEKVRSDTSAAVAAARGQASDAVAAAREAATVEIAHWKAHSANMERWARGEVANQLLAVPIPPWELRNRIGTVENTIDALYQIDHVLEVVLAEDVESPFVPDLEYTRNLTARVQEQARDLTRELANLPSRYLEPPQVEVATGYAEAAGDAYRALLQRIDTAIQRIGRRFHSPDAEILAVVAAMVADLREQGLD